MDKLVYILYPILLLVFLAGARPYGRGKWNEEFMTLDQTKYLQGFAVICVMMHHIAQETCADWQSYPLLPGLEFFVPIGYFFVAFFLFCSGYGLFKSYKTKTDYLKGFFGKRMLLLILAFYSTGWIFLIARILMKQKMDQKRFLFYFSGYMLSNPNAWYAIALPLFYLFFYLSFRFFKKDWMKIAGVMLGMFLYTFLGTWIDHNDYLMNGEWWYNSVHLFWIGMLFARFEKTIVEKLKKYYWLFTILAVVLMLGGYWISEWAQAVFSYYGEYNWNLTHWMVVKNRWLCLLTQMVASTGFVFWVLLMNLKLRVGNRLLALIGKITLEFYLIHGLFLEFFSYRFCDVVPSITRIKNVPLLTLMVFVPSVIAAVGLQKLHRKILNITAGK